MDRLISNLWYRDPTPHNNIAARMYTLGMSPACNCFKKMEMAAVKNRAIAEP